MAISLNDNLKINAGKPADSKYLNLSNQPYVNITEVNNTIPISERYIGLTVNINNIEYWFKTGVTNGDLVLKTVDVGSGENISKEINQLNHGFTVGEVIAYSGNIYVRAIADGTLNGEVFGLVTEVIDVDNFVLTFAGYVDTLSGATLQADTLYYLSDQNIGELTINEPIELGHISKPILYTTSASEGFVLNQRGVVLATGSTSGGSTSGITQVLNVGSGQNLFKSIISTPSGLTAQFRRIQNGIGTSIVTSGDSIIVNVTGSTVSIGSAEDGDYTDGLFTDFTPSTPIGTPIDRFNELFALLVPQPAPNLDNITGGGTFVSGLLSFGTSRNDIGYTNVSNAAGLGARDINTLFNITSSSGRLGITQTAVSGVLNDDINGNQNGVSIPFDDNAFGNANEGFIVLELNGVNTNTLDLTQTSNSTSNTINNTTISVSELKSVKFDNGNDFNVFQYRTGTFNIQTLAMNDGYNYLQIQHVGVGGNPITNFVDWVYDPNTDAIAYLNEQIIDYNLIGSKFISGVEYNTGGSVDYRIDASNAYKNIYTPISNGVEFPIANNINPVPVAITISGTGINTGTSRTLPSLRTDVTNPENRNIVINATLGINTNTLFGIESIGIGTRVNHPYAYKESVSTGVTDDGFLIYNINQTSSLTTENFTGEVNRMETRDYPSIVNVYNNLDSNQYLWSGSQDLISGNAQHSNGMLVFNGELLYPNAAYLTSEYGITTGNFSVLTNAPVGNPNYTAASGQREYYRRFRKTSAGNLDNIQFSITHTGNLASFLTDGDDGGVPSSSSQIKMEMAIIRANGQVFNWSNPFSVNNSINVTVSSSAHIGGTTNVTAQFSDGSPTIGQNDFVIVRLKFGATYSNRVSNLAVTNF